MEKVAFVFPGQGTQFAQMGKLIYDNYLIARRTFEEVSEVSNIDLENLCFKENIVQLNNFSNMQLAILTTEIATFRAFINDYGITPQFVAGHSIGEYAALVAAGALQLSDAVKIMLKRGELVNRIMNKNIGHMAIVENCTANKIRECIAAADAKDAVFISCYNSNSQNTLSGLHDKMEDIEKRLADQGVKLTPLLFSPPIHSPIMHEISTEFVEYLRSIVFYDLRFPVITNYTGKPLMNKNELPTILSHQLWNEVQFTSAINIFDRYGITSVIEMSPKKLLSIFISENCPNMKTFCYGIQKDKMLFDEYMSSIQMFQKGNPNFCERCLICLETTPNNNDCLEEVQQSIEIYNQIKGMRGEQMVSKGKEEMLTKLIQALLLKRIDNTLIRTFIKDILDETNSYYDLFNFYTSNLSL
ncbi:MAG: ACP S-malonyltransferase [Eubacteriales bacterium]|nr:ACP S-malonyltransferase [Eubacteriales bacterium]